MSFIQRTLGGAIASRDKDHKYAAVPSDNLDNVDVPAEDSNSDDPLEELEAHLKRARSSRQRRRLLTMGLSFLGVGLAAFYAISVVARPTEYQNASCDTVEYGYQCQTNISHFWGQYSPYFSVASEISSDLPATCEITFVQILSRHGARDPTASKTEKYNKTITKLQKDVSDSAYTGDYAFLKDFVYSLGADQLTVFGEQELINSGIKFYNRYEALTKDHVPFVRTAGEARVVESAQNWTQGFHSAKLQDQTASLPDSYPYSILIIPEGDGINNTLSHDLCTSFEDGYDSTISDSAQGIWSDIFAPNITARLNANLPGADLSDKHTIDIMDLCPFYTVASTTGQISDFCKLFTEDEWQAYGYYQSLGKYYGYSYGNPLGPTQGVGWTNELIARLTDTPVNDHTSTNSTLDDNNATFPLGGNTKVYADFSHDNDMTGIFSALNLFNSTVALSNTTLETTNQTNGYSAGWTVPFASRAYFEKMSCTGETEELVRVILNDRVLPLDSCGGDDLGRCTLSNFVASLAFAEEGGDWAQCF